MILKLTKEENWIQPLFDHVKKGSWKSGKGQAISLGFGEIFLMTIHKTKTFCTLVREWKMTTVT